MRLLLLLLVTTTAIHGFSYSGITQRNHQHRRSTFLSATQQQQSQQQQDVSKHAPVVDDPSFIRNVAFVGHSHSGKTALIETLLHQQGVVSRNVLDSDPTEAARQSSVFSHFCRILYGKNLLQISDTPWGDFPTDALAALQGADAALLVVSAADGVQAGTVQAYQHCTQVGIKTLVCLSKLDRPFVQVDQVLHDLEASLGMAPVPLQVPVYNEKEEFVGVEPLFVLSEDGSIEKNSAPITAEAYTVLEEAVAMTNDELLMVYLEEGQLEVADLVEGLQMAVRQHKLLPLVYTSALQQVGLQELMASIVATLPNPLVLREDAIAAACEANAESCNTLEPGVEGGFCARVLHTTVDAFGSMSVLRVISNAKEEGEGYSAQLPDKAVDLRTGDTFKMPSVSMGLCGKERLPLPTQGNHLNPGDIIAVPKLPDSVCTNDILTVAEAATEEEQELHLEEEHHIWTPLSRPVEAVPLMTSAIVELADVGGKKRGGGGGSGDDKLLKALAALAREDLALELQQESGLVLLHGMSAEHLQLVVSRLNQRYGLDVVLKPPPVPYRETLSKKVSKLEGKHKKQSGGSGQFGVCYLDMEPLERGAGIEFVSTIKGGAISKPFINSVEKGVYEQLQNHGGKYGFPVTDVRVTLVDGKMHSVDSKDIAFQNAGRLAVKAALEQGGTQLLQPMQTVQFQVPANLQGDVNAIVSRFHGYVTATTSAEDLSGVMHVEAILPQACLGSVSDMLRAASAGEGQFTHDFSHYQVVPEEEVSSVLGINEEDGKSGGGKLMP